MFKKSISIVTLLILALLSIMPINKAMADVMSVEELKHFKNVFLEKDDSVVEKWKKPVRIFVTVDERYRNFVIDVVKMLDETSNLKIELTNDSVNCVVVFTDNFYKEAFANGERYFSGFLKSGEDFVRYFAEFARKDDYVRKFIRYGLGDDHNIYSVFSMIEISLADEDRAKKIIFKTILEILFGSSEFKFNYDTAFDRRNSRLTLTEQDQSIIKALYSDQITPGMGISEIGELK